jgi:uncharacterized membrane protein
MGMSDKDSGNADTGAGHLHRLILFSDAVFAIAITLLAIEIHPPHHWHGVPDLFRQMAPHLITYAVSFGVIGIYWVSHRRIFSRLASANGVLDALNFVVLGLIGLLPLGTELLWRQEGGQAFPVYLTHVALIGFALALLWAYAVFVGKLAKPIALPEALFVLVRVALLPGLMCALAFFSIANAWGWGVMALLTVVLARAGAWIERKYHLVAEEAAA